jgi:hypothetical protein
MSVQNWYRFYRPTMYSPTETLVEFGFGCKYNNNNRRIRFYYQVINVVINTTIIVRLL